VYAIIKKYTNEELGQQMVSNRRGKLKGTGNLETMRLETKA